MNTIDRLDPVAWVPTPPRCPRIGPLPWHAALSRWWGRLFATGAATRAAPPDDFAALAELDPHLLADIGAPQHLLERAFARREQQQQERDDLKTGLAAGAWRHW